MQQPPFDINAALKRTAGDRQLLGELAKLCCQEVTTLLPALRAAVAQRDGGKLAKAAHTLKGAVGAFGPSKAFEAALDLEKLGRNGTLADVEVKLGHLEEALQELVPALQALDGTGGTSG